LKEYGLDKDFKLNIEPNHSTLAGHDYEHDIEIASRYGMLGSIDANTGDPLLGWDTDQFPMDIKKATLLAQIIVRQGGLAPGGLNFDCKVRRESIDIEDMFIAHIGAMDTLARGLRNWAKIHEDGTMETLLKERYISWESDIGKKIESNECTFEELEQWVLHHGEPTTRSGKQEKFEVIFNNLI
jgi:xylose isomerase